MYSEKKLFAAIVSMNNKLLEILLLIIAPPHRRQVGITQLKLVKLTTSSLKITTETTENSLDFPSSFTFGAGLWKFGTV